MTVETVIWAAIAVAVSGGLYVALQEGDEALRKGDIASDIGQAVFELTVLTGDYLLHHEKRAQIQWERKHESLGRVLREPGFGRAEEAPALAVVQANHVEIGEIFARLVATYPARRAPGGRTDLSLALEQRLVAQLLTRSQTMVSRAFELVSQGEADVRESARRAAWLAIVLGVSIVIAVGGTWIVAVLQVVRPIRTLHRGIQILAGGDLDYRIGVTGRDEIGEVGNAFNAMAAERKRAEEQLRGLAQSLERRTAELAAANKELEAFSYSVSHDLRAPLRSMSGFSQALVEDYGDKLDPNARHYLERVRAASKRMSDLIDELLMLSRVTRSELKRETVDMSGLARDVAAELQATQAERRVAFEIMPGVTAEGDAWQLRLVVENLIGNAWKFTRDEAEAKIEFGLTEQDGEVVYHVRDNGVGFDMAYADKLFGPFQRLHTAAEFEGAGIGLATVARLVWRHGGRVWAEAAPGQGATFYFTLGKGDERHEG